MKKQIILIQDKRLEAINLMPEHYQTVVGKTKKNYQVGDCFSMVLSLRSPNNIEVKEHVMVKVIKLEKQYILVEVPNLEKGDK